MKNRTNIFITGTSGFIGSHLIEAGQQGSFHIFALIRREPVVRFPKNVTVVYGDVNDGPGLKKIFSDFRRCGINIDYVIHAAAVTKSNSKKELFDTNYLGTQKLIHALQDNNIAPKKIIFLSSLAASGPTEPKKQIFLSQESPITLYGQSKLQAEKIIIKSGMPFVIIRPTAVYGPGEKDLFTVFKFISRGINPILGNHSQVLTFIYVKDLVKLIFTAMESDIENEIYFASDGNLYDKHSLSQAINKALDKKALDIKFPLIVVRIAAFFSQYINALIGKVSPLNLEKYNELVAESWNCEITKTILHFDFEPEFRLEKGVQRTTEWYKQNKWI